MRFRPAIVPTLLAGGALVILVNLGLWQLRRHHESQIRQADIHAHLAEPLATNADLARPPAELGWRHASLTGRFVDVPPYLIAARFEFGQPGYDVIVPFAVDGGPTVLVDRGWIPSDGWKDALAAANANLPTQIDGLLMVIEGDPTLQPMPPSGDHPERWPQETDTYAGCASRVVGPPWAALARRAGDVAGVYLVVGPELQRDQTKPHQTMPVSGYVAEPYQIGHLSYAIQWFLIAGTLVVVWAYAGIVRVRTP